MTIHTEPIPINEPIYFDFKKFSSLKKKESLQMIEELKENNSNIVEYKDSDSTPISNSGNRKDSNLPLIKKIPGLSKAGGDETSCNLFEDETLKENSEKSSYFLDPEEPEELPEVTSLETKRMRNIPKESL